GASPDVCVVVVLVVGPEGVVRVGDVGALPDVAHHVLTENDRRRSSAPGGAVDQREVGVGVGRVVLHIAFNQQVIDGLVRHPSGAETLHAVKMIPAAILDV